MTQTHLIIRVKPGQRDTAIAAVRARRVFEECAEAMAGFLGAELLLSADNPEELCIIAHWRDHTAAFAWLASPVREAQNQDLAHIAAEPPFSRIFEPAGYEV